jgi:hypothetical protein
MKCCGILQVIQYTRDNVQYSLPDTTFKLLLAQIMRAQLNIGIKYIRLMQHYFNSDKS